MKASRISIIIPSYNKVRFIERTLDSIVKQEYPNLEVIIQDGGSTDGTLEKIKKFAQKYPAVIKFESKKDEGQLDAINKGFSKASGEILTYINADDIYTQDAFSEVARLCSVNPGAYWFAGRGKVINSSGEEIAKTVTWYKNLLLSLNSKSCLLVTNYLMQPSVFITRKAWEKFGPFTGTPDFVTEYDLWLKLARRSMPAITSKYLSSFRISGENISSVSYTKLLNDDYKIVKRYTKNILILTLHKIHNLARIALIKNI